MRKFNTWVEHLSLSQQLFSLIFVFITFFCCFFFIYLNGNINEVIKSQAYSSLEREQETFRGLIENSDTTWQKLLLNGSLESTFQHFMITDANTSNPQLQIVANNAQQANEVISTDLLKHIEKSINQMDGADAKAFEYHGDNTTTYYRIMAITDDKWLLTLNDNKYQELLKDSLLSSVVNITVVVVGVFFVILMIWMAALIHPLNQIRNYIDKVKNGEDAQLKINRQDEIGALARALVDMRQELQRQEKTKEEMIHNISHDLKTPIATIKSYGESIKDGIYPYETLEKSVDVIINNADRLEKKVHSLLYLNRVEYLVSQDIEGALTDMNVVIDNVILSIKAIRDDVVIETDLQPEVFFTGLEESWRVAIENILENALRYAKSKIKIVLREDEVAISNDGPSMSEERIAALFKPFEKGQDGQFGIGLSIVAKVVHANGYTVSGENTSDGVIFRMSKVERKEKKETKRRAKDNKTA